MRAGRDQGGGARTTAASFPSLPSPVSTSPIHSPSASRECHVLSGPLESSHAEESGVALEVKGSCWKESTSSGASDASDA